MGFISRAAGEVYTMFRPDEPWISHKAVRFLEKSLNESMSGLEWGSGRSTLWYARKLGHLISVEHDSNWHQLIRERISRQNLTNVDYRFIALDHPENDPTYPNYAMTPKYVDVISSMPDESLDFVVIDGHYRQACLQAVQRKLKHGGLLLLDNSNWMSLEEWQAPSWPIAHQSSGFYGETTIWKKP